MRYEHTQGGHFHWIVLSIGAVEVAAGLALPMPAEIRGLLLGLGLFLGLVAFCFARLTVREEEEHLVVVFGPLPLFRRRVAYADIRSFRTARSALVDGWGIHWFPGRGWTWNLWGRDCLELATRTGPLRIGTDDPAGLADHLGERLGGEPGEPPAAVH